MFRSVTLKQAWLLTSNLKHMVLVMLIEPFLCCVSLISTPSWVYHCPSVLSYLTGSGVGVWVSSVNKSASKQTHLLNQKLTKLNILRWMSSRPFMASLSTSFAHNYNNMFLTFTSSTFLCNLKIFCICLDVHWTVQGWRWLTRHCHHFWNGTKSK